MNLSGEYISEGIWPSLLTSFLSAASLCCYCHGGQLSKCPPVDASANCFINSLELKQKDTDETGTAAVRKDQRGAKLRSFNQSWKDGNDSLCSSYRCCEGRDVYSDNRASTQQFPQRFPLPLLTIAAVPPMTTRGLISGFFQNKHLTDQYCQNSETFVFKKGGGVKLASCELSGTPPTFYLQLFKKLCRVRYQL